MPDDWKRLTEADMRELRAEVEFQLSKENGEEEFEALMTLGKGMICGTDVPSGSGAGSSNDAVASAPIKQEQTPGEQMAEKVEALVAQKDQTLQRMRSHNLESRAMSEKAKNGRSSKAKTGMCCSFKSAPKSKL